MDIDFFSADEIAPILADYERIYGLPDPSGSGRARVETDGESIGAFRPDQFRNIDQFPYEGGREMNMISMHPQLIAFARALLDAPQVHMYQSHTWAKYTGEADYDQVHHCDFSNHTLTVPSDDVTLRTVDFIIYYTDVTDAHGALHYVTKPDAGKILRPGTVFAPEDKQQALKAVEKSAAAPAGTLLAHSIDTFHRGTNLTKPGGHRFTMTVGYKAAGNDMISFHIWQQAAGRNWEAIFRHASPEQLRVIGIPLPGDSFWTERTLKLTRARWPEWDMTPYFEAARLTS